MVRHNELHDGVSNLSGKAFTPMYMCDDPKLFTGRVVLGGNNKAKGKVKGEPPPDYGVEKGEILIRYLWTQGTDIIHNMGTVNTDAVSYQSKKTDNCLETIKQ